MESDGVMDGQHSTFENVFEMCQKVETAEVEGREGAVDSPPRTAAGAKVGAQCSLARSCFNLQIDPNAAGGRRRHILRSTASLPLVARTNASRQTTHQEYGRRLALAGMLRFTMLFISF